MINPHSKFKHSITSQYKHSGSKSISGNFITVFYLFRAFALIIKFFFFHNQNGKSSDGGGVGALSTGGGGACVVPAAFGVNISILSATISVMYRFTPFASS